MLAGWLSAGIMLLVGILLTQPDELRLGRWPKIIISIPFAMVIGLSYTSMGFAFFSFFAVLFLAHVWKGNVSYLLAGPVVQTMTGASDTAVPDFRRAKLELRDGHVQDALRLAEKELNKDPWDIEGLLLVGGLFFAVDNPDRSLDCMLRVLAHPDATDAQRARATEQKNQLEEVIRLRQLQASEI